MKAFEPYVNCNFNYPEYMELIVEYLKNRGK